MREQHQLIFNPLHKLTGDTRPTHPNWKEEAGFPSLEHICFPVEHVSNKSCLFLSMNNLKRRMRKYSNLNWKEVLQHNVMFT
jgi:hypothetical protein